jgi:hypothetical protein
MVKKKKLKVIKAAKGQAAPGPGDTGGEGGYGRDTNQFGGQGRDPRAQYKDSKPLSQKSRQALTTQRERARGRISPSTTLGGKIATYGAALAFGVPTSITSRAIDYSPLAFGVPGGKKSTKDDKTTKDRDGLQKITRPVIAGPVPVSPAPLSQVVPVRARPTVSPTGSFGYSVGLRKGGLLRQGKPKLAKKGWK